ncbi:MAG: nitroreductase family protein [Syntrophomonas sp.]
MELKTTIEQRRSIRKFRPEPVPEHWVVEVLEAARLAPSGGNIQPWKYVVIESPEARQKLSQFTLGFVAAAPVVIVCCTDLNAYAEQSKRYKELKESGAFKELAPSSKTASYKAREMDRQQLLSYLNLNTTIAVEHLILRATDLGLGSCWVMMFKRKELAAWLELEEYIYPLCLVPLGFSAESPPQRPRKTLEEIVYKVV